MRQQTSSVNVQFIEHLPAVSYTHKKLIFPHITSTFFGEATGGWKKLFSSSSSSSSSISPTESNCASSRFFLAIVLLSVLLRHSICSRSRIASRFVCVSGSWRDGNWNAQQWKGWVRKAFSRSWERNENHVRANYLNT